MGREEGGGGLHDRRGQRLNRARKPEVAQAQNRKPLALLCNVEIVMNYMIKYMIAVSVTYACERI